MLNWTYFPPQAVSKFFIISSFYGLAILLPIDITDSNLKDSDGFSSLDRLTVSNLKDGSSRFWAHTVYTWLMALLIMGVLWNEYQYYILIREEWYEGW